MMYIFADCQLDPEQFTLHRQEQATRLRPKVFQVLMYLLENRDRVVTRQELAEQVWPDQTISDAALESGVRAARRVVGDSGRTQRVIQLPRPWLPLYCLGCHPPTPLTSRTHLAASPLS